MTATITIYTQELQDILTIQAKAMNFEPEPAILSEYYAQEGIEEAGLQIPPEEGASPETGNSPEGGFPPESFTPGTGGPAGSPPAVMQNTAPDAPTIVYVQNAEGLIVPRPVKLGANDGINVEVISGLNVGDEVVYRIVETEVATDYEEETRSPFMPGPPR